MRVTQSLELVESAKADFYPNINLTAMAGLTSLGLNKLLNAGSFNANIAPAIHLPIFDAGRIQAQYQRSKADVELSIASYNQKLSTAAGEASDAWARLQGLGKETRWSEEQIQARQHELKLAQLRRANGLADGREPRRLTSQLIVLQDKALATQVQTLMAVVDLNKALGGGYAPSDLPVNGP
jgi:multidrug efflux system outer membrane protein